MIKSREQNPAKYFSELEEPKEQTEQPKTIHYLVGTGLCAGTIIATQGERVWILRPGEFQIFNPHDPDAILS